MDARPHRAPARPRPGAQRRGSNRRLDLDRYGELVVYTADPPYIDRRPRCGRWSCSAVRWCSPRAARRPPVRSGSRSPAFGDPYDVDAGPGGTAFVVDTAASGAIRRIASDGTALTVPTG